MRAFFFVGAVFVLGAVHAHAGSLESSNPDGKPVTVEVADGPYDYDDGGNIVTGQIVSTTSISSTEDGTVSFRACNKKMFTVDRSRLTPSKSECPGTNKTWWTYDQSQEKFIATGNVATTEIGSNTITLENFPTTIQDILKTTDKAEVANSFEDPNGSIIFQILKGDKPHT